MNRFTNIQVISHGGMATIYKADDAETGTVVALKEVLDSPGFSEALRKQLQHRLQREAKTLITLDHPNIVRCYGVSEQDGRMYIVTEFLSGTTLEQEIVSGRIVGDRARILSAFQQICNGMEYARHKGVVHRDLKPANLFLCPGNCAKVIDFGIARLDDGISLTMPEQVLGTPHYMSPEQTLGAHDVDYRADIFSLGVCLYHAATGELPFNGQGRAEVTGAIRSQPFPQGRVWADLDPIVKRALEKDPRERWASFAELEGALRSVATEFSAETVPELETTPPRAAPVPPVGAQPIRQAVTSNLEQMPLRDAPVTAPVVPRPAPADPEATGGGSASTTTWRYMAAAGIGVVGLVLFPVGLVGAVFGFALLLAAVGLVVFTAAAASNGSTDRPRPAVADAAMPFPSLDHSPLLMPSAPMQPSPTSDGGIRLRYRVNGLSMVSKPAPAGQVVIGRLPEAHISVPDDARVSSRHATVSPLTDGTYRLTDHSSNGTWVDGARVTSVAIRPGTEFRVGATLLCIDGPV